MGLGVPQHDTQLFVEMYICSEFLHCSHEEFLKLPRLERKKCKMYLQVKNEKSKYELDEMDRKHKNL